jgi:predicted RNase H-like HicB family nuclease
MANMKTKRELERRGHFGFNAIDPKSGYAIRFESSKQGYWWVHASQIAAFSFGLTLRQARVMISESIEVWLEAQAEMGWPIPTPSLAHAYHDKD